MLGLRLLRPAACRPRLYQYSPLIATNVRTFSSFKPVRATIPPKIAPKEADEEAFYHGPLAKTFQSLKTFSLSSLGLCVTVTPFIYLIDSAMATSARTGIVAFAILTSSASTALIGWLGSPYTIAMRRLNPATTKTSAGKPIAPGAVELYTKNVWLQDRFTRVYDPIFLGPTKRPFAKWELLTSAIVDTTGEVVPRKAGDVEVIAETFDKKGKVKGQWFVKWRQQSGASDAVLSGIAGGQGGIVR